MTSSYVIEKEPRFSSFFDLFGLSCVLLWGNCALSSSRYRVRASICTNQVAMLPFVRRERKSTSANENARKRSRRRHVIEYSFYNVSSSVSVPCDSRAPSVRAVAVLPDNRSADSLGVDEIPRTSNAVAQKSTNTQSLPYSCVHESIRVQV